MPSAPDESALAGRLHGARRSRLAVVHAFFRFLDAERVGWVLLGRGVEAAVEGRGDLDLVIEPCSIGRLSQLVWRFCREQELRCIRVLRHEWNAFNFALAWRDPATATLEILQLDLCGDYGRSGRHFVPAAELIGSRVQRAAHLFVPSPSLALITYLLKKVDKQELSTAGFDFMHARWHEAPRASLAQLMRFFGEPLARRASRAIESGAAATLHELLPLLRTTLRRRIRRSARDRLRELQRLAVRALRPEGLWVAVLGPDGAGKSTLLERVATELAPLFRSVRAYHLRPHWLGGAPGRAPVTAPHAVRARGRLASLAKLCLWWLDANGGYLLDLYPRLARAQLLLFDRHVWDLLVDPRRYRHRGSPRIAALCCASTFQPALFVLLDAPVDVIHARKLEVARDEVERQRRAYSDLRSRLPCSRVVDAARGLDDVSRDVVDCILARFELRTARRLGFAPLGGEPEDVDAAACARC